MNEMAATVSLLAGLSDASGGPLARLRRRLPLDINPSVSSELFTGVSATRDAGVAVQLTATRGDGRAVSWLVEAWVYLDGPDAWRVNIKAEIDLNDSDGDDRCVLNEQEIITDVADIRDAIDRAARLVADYPTDDLLTDGWQPSDWDDA
jgi:hypothetical protein